MSFCTGVIVVVKRWFRLSFRPLFTNRRAKKASKAAGSRTAALSDGGYALEGGALVLKDPSKCMSDICKSLNRLAVDLDSLDRNSPEFREFVRKRRLPNLSLVTSQDLEKKDE